VITLDSIVRRVDVVEDTDSDACFRSTARPLVRRKQSQQRSVMKSRLEMGSELCL